jgi:uncharacterized protein YeaO (DUF488 family)
MKLIKRNVETFQKFIEKYEPELNQRRKLRKKLKAQKEKEAIEQGLQNIKNSTEYAKGNGSVLHCKQ